MKIRNLLISLAAVLILASCEKNDDDKSYRLSRVLEEYGSSYYMDSLWYDGNNLTRIMYYQKDGDGEWYETYKTEITYNGDQVTLIEYEKESTGFELNMKSEYIVDDGLVLEESRYSYETDTWELSWKWTYQYSGNKLAAWNSYSPDGAGSYYVDGKCEYTYQDGKLNESMEYYLDGNDAWQPEEKTTYSYDENLLVNWTRSRVNGPDSWLQNYKNDFFYTEDQITGMDSYYWSSDTWNLSESCTYTYNNNGYLYEYDNGHSNETYEYEEGKGNAKFFYYYAEEMVDGEPKVKSASTNPNRTYVPYYKRMLNRPKF